MSSTGSEIYNDTAAFGRVWAIIIAVIMSIVGILLIIMGILSLRSKEAKVTATVKADTDCSGKKCLTKVTYTVDNKVYNKTFETSDLYNAGDTITLYYLDDATKAHLKSTKHMAPALIVMGAVIVLVGWIIVYLTKKFKAFAALEGISAGLRRW